MKTENLTVAQAIVRYLIAEGVEYVFGIFGHGNVAGLGEHNALGYSPSCRPRCARCMPSARWWRLVL